MASLNLHFGTSVTVLPSLEVLIVADLLRQNVIDLLYVEHRKAVRKQYEAAQNVAVKRGFDTLYTLKSGVQIAMTSEVVSVTESDVYVETMAMSMAEYAERTRKLMVLLEYMKRHPPIQ